MESEIKGNLFPHLFICEVFVQVVKVSGVTRFKGLSYVLVELVIVLHQKHRVVKVL